MDELNEELFIFDNDEISKECHIESYDYCVDGIGDPQEFFDNCSRIEITNSLDELENSVRNVHQKK